MKYLAVIILTFLLISCDSGNSNKERFIKTYKEILVVREIHKDSLEANKRVMEIIRKNGYTEPEFKQAFFELAKERKNYNLIDSIRNLVQDEIREIEKENLKKRDSANKSSEKVSDSESER